MSISLRLRLREKKFDEALGYYEKALSISATDNGALNGLIRVYAERKELNKAHARLDQAINTYPNNAALHYLKGTVYGIERNPQGTEAEMRKTLELDPNYVAAYSALGALFVNTNQEDRAIEEYKRIISLRPDNATAYTLIGMLYDGRKTTTLPPTITAKLSVKITTRCIAANNLAWLYAIKGKGNIDEAVRLAQGVVQKNSTLPASSIRWDGFITRRVCMRRLWNNLQKAVALDEAGAKNANVNPSPVYRYHLGMALKAKGDNAGAKRELSLGIAFRR